MITELLAEADVQLGELNAVVLGNGPGSFIGMRIGASVAQGLSFGAGLDIVPVSSLAAVAAEAFTQCDADCVVVVQDARMNEVYLGLFERGDSGLPVSLGKEEIVVTGALSIAAVEYAAAGAGWDRYPELKAANQGNIFAQVPVLYPDARHLLALGRHAFDAGEGVAPASLAPAYLRTKVAEIPASKN
jgi:tRNA threonylcarbamoyladenosine biosynthesis protein TsaB